MHIAVAAILRQARVAWQLSLREGFEVKVTETLMKGIPMIATKAGGIPLQIKDRETGFLVEVGDVAAGMRLLSRLIISRTPC